MKRKIIGVIAAVVLAAVGTGMLVAYVSSAEDRALAGEEVVEVLVVTEPIEEGTPAADITGSVTTERIPIKVRAEGAIDDIERLGSRVAAVDLVPGEQVVMERFVTPGELGTFGQVPAPDDLLQTTVALSAERAAGGRLQPGATVGILASYGEMIGFPETTHFIVHQALVTSVQGDVVATDADDPNQSPSGNVLVTIALSAPDVERLVFAAEFGAIWLAFEPEDVPNDGTREVTRAEAYP